MQINVVCVSILVVIVKLCGIVQLVINVCVTVTNVLVNIMLITTSFREVHKHFCITPLLYASRLFILGLSFVPL